MSWQNLVGRFELIFFARVILGPFLVLALSACNPAKFEGQAFSSMGVESLEILSKSFKISEVSFTLEQETLGEDVTTLDSEGGAIAAEIQSAV